MQKRLKNICKKSKKQKMSFEQLPKVLKSVVCEFAFACNWAKTDSSLKMCEKIASYNISPVFLRSQMWSWSYGEFLPTPLDVFLPIHQFTGRWSDIVDWHAVNELLFRLDFRRKVVQVGGTRHEWFQKFRENWLNICLFDSFFRAMLHSTIPCFKPTYRVRRFESLGTFNSPFWSARWILQDWGS